MRSEGHAGGIGIRRDITGKVITFYSTYMIDDWHDISP